MFNIYQEDNISLDSLDIVHEKFKSVTWST